MYFWESVPHCGYNVYLSFRDGKYFENAWVLERRVPFSLLYLFLPTASLLLLTYITSLGFWTTEIDRHNFKRHPIRQMQWSAVMPLLKKLKKIIIWKHLLTIKGYNSMPVWLAMYYEMMASVGSANIHLLAEIQEKLKEEEKKKEKGFLVMKTSGFTLLTLLFINTGSHPVLTPLGPYWSCNWELVPSTNSLFFHRRLW